MFRFLLKVCQGNVLSVVAVVFPARLDLGVATVTGKPVVIMETVMRIATSLKR
jgi:hypothetical protein